MEYSDDHSIRLDELVNALKKADLVVNEISWGSRRNVDVRFLTQDSRRIERGAVFFAIRGRRWDGHRFIDDAVADGAVAVVCEQLEGTSIPTDTAIVPVNDSRRALTIAAQQFFGRPDQSLNMVGVTGTNGKTTTVALASGALRRLGYEVGSMGTLGCEIGNQQYPLDLTTPDPVELHRLLRSMVDHGCGINVMEVSSHALDQQRVDPSVMDVGVFTNLSQDHLDYHGDMDSYQAAKQRLFDELPESAVAVYNADDPSGGEMVRNTRARRSGYGMQTEEIEISGKIRTNQLDGLTISLNDQTVASRLGGRFNAYNLLAAYGICQEVVDDPPQKICEALEQVPPVPGRLEAFRFDDGTVAVVDYAHTPDALEQVLYTVRDAMPPNTTLWLVFGCGGDRDADKRPVMGNIASRLADRVIITSDNPRSEDPNVIIDDIWQGIREEYRSTEIPDRSEAIRYAAERSTAGDTVLVAGKGHERYQIVGEQKYPFDDRAEVRKWFGRFH